MKYHNIKGVIFDLGSTLIDYDNRSWVEMRVEGRRLGYRQLVATDNSLPDFEIFNARIEKIMDSHRAVAVKTLKEWTITQAFTEAFEEFGIADAAAYSERIAEAFFGVVRAQGTLCSGAIETLRELEARGLIMGLISNTVFPGKEHERDLDRFDLKRYLEFRVYSCELGVRKPKAEIFQEGLRRIGLTAAETVYVGDRYYEDVQGPRAIGMPAVLKFREGRDYPEPLPDDFAVIHRLPELLDIIEKTT